MLQTLAGRPRLDGSWPLVGLVAASVLLLLPAVLVTLLGLAVRRSPPASL